MHLSRQKVLFIASAFLVALLISSTATFFQLYKQEQTRYADFARKVQAETVTPSLPASAIKVSECIPFMGEHWVSPDHLPNGPFYLVYQGKIMGLEFMFAPDDILGERIAKMTLPEFESYLTKNNLTLGDVIKGIAPKYDLQGLKFTNFSLEWSSPHAGQPIPHYDLHLYLVEDAELQSVCPNATTKDAITPEILENIQKNNIPFPGLPQNNTRN